MLLFNSKEFYPTPNFLTAEMFEDIDWNCVSSVLEPSAGKGDIAKEIIKKLSEFRNNPDLDCIEKDDDLQKYLKSQNYRVIFDDFLHFNTHKFYSLIIMNPPFSNGDKHLLKAISLAKKNGGGQISCVLNAETLKNPYSNTRIDLIQQLKDYNAKIRYEKAPFKSAERTTDVDIAIIYINIPCPPHKSFILDELKNSQEVKEFAASDENFSLTSSDFTESITAQFDMELKAGLQLIEEYYAMHKILLSDLEETRYSSPILNLTLKYSSDLSSNDYIKAVRLKYWKAFFENPQITKHLTCSVLEKYRKHISSLSNYDFSKYNIACIRLEMSKEMQDGVLGTIFALFEELSYEHSYYASEYCNNIHYYNGWTTNKAYIINQKVIIPLSAWDEIWKKFRYDSRIIESLEDIEKIFTYLDCHPPLHESYLNNILLNAEREGQTKNIHLRYFDVTFFKKGTCHIEFTNKELLKKFNIIGSRHRGWLPPSYGTKHYSDMTKEEQSTIDSFQGKADYEDTLSDTTYNYLVSPQLKGLPDVL